MKKLFVCDFDGTLYKKNNDRLYNAALKEIERLKALGNEFVVASGRPLHLLKPYFENFENMFFISNDGAVFSKGFNILYSVPLDKQAVKNSYRNYTGDFIAYGQCITYAKYKNKSVGFKLDEFFNHHLTNVNCVCEIQENIYKITFMGKAHKADFLDECWNSYGVTEYVTKGVSKGECLKLVQKALGFTSENTVVIGDGENDLSMMEYADVSYAMMNASPKVKARATKTAESVLDILRGEM